jgi:hypothetical protein
VLRILNEIRIDFSGVELCTLLVLRFINIGVKFGSLELLEGLVDIVLRQLAIRIDFTPGDAALLLPADRSPL